MNHLPPSINQARSLVAMASECFDWAGPLANLERGGLPPLLAMAAAMEFREQVSKVAPHRAHAKSGLTENTPEGACIEPSMPAQKKLLKKWGGESMCDRLKPLISTLPFLIDHNPPFTPLSPPRFVVHQAEHTLEAAFSALRRGGGAGGSTVDGGDPRDREASLAQCASDVKSAAAFFEKAGEHKAVNELTDFVGPCVRNTHTPCAHHAYISCTHHAHVASLPAVGTAS